jgi:hypothetical protein
VFLFEALRKVSLAKFQKDTLTRSKTHKTSKKEVYFTPNSFGTDIAYSRAKQNK